jgi:ribosome-binding factor A
MPREFPRTRRVGEQIQRELAGLVHEEIKDPRLGLVSISGVEVSTDMAHAKVYVSVLGNDDAVTASIQVLNNAAGFLRRRLGAQMHLRTVPRLRFYHDRSLVEGARMDALIHSALYGAGEQEDKDPDSGSQGSGSG